MIHLCTEGLLNITSIFSPSKCLAREMGYVWGGKKDYVLFVVAFQITSSKSVQHPLCLCSSTEVIQRIQILSIPPKGANRHHDLLSFYGLEVGL